MRGRPVCLTLLLAGLLLGVLPLGLAGCSLFGTGHTVHATLAQDGTAVRLAPGDDLAITLPNVSGDTFDWAPVRFSEDVLSYGGDPESIRTLRNGRPDPYAPAFERHTFRARGSGKGEILMGPPGVAAEAGGDERTEPARAFRLGVIVR